MNENEIKSTREYLIKELKRGRTCFEFRKADGTFRSATGTLLFDLIPQQDHPQNESGEQRQDNDNLVVYYDLDKMAWRSCRVDRIVTIDGENV